MNRMKERRGTKTLKQIEREIGRSYLDKPRLSQIETGKLNPVPGDIPAFLVAYGAEEVTELWDASDLDYGVKRPCGGRKPDRNKKTGRIHIRTTQKIAKRFHAIRKRYGYHTGEACFIAALDALEQAHEDAEKATGGSEALLSEREAQAGAIAPRKPEFISGFRTSNKGAHGETAVSLGNKKRTAPTAGTVETAGVSRSPQSNDSPSIGQGGQNVNDSSAISKPI